MAHTHTPHRPAVRPRRRRGGVWLAVAFVLAVTGTGAGVVAWQARPRRPDLPTHVVAYEALRPTLVVRGSLGAAEQSDIFCRVRGSTRGGTYATTIKWVVDDGTYVHRGQLLAELDDSALQEDLYVRRIWLDQAWSAWVQAEEQHKIAEWQAEGDVHRAQVGVELAALDLLKYLKGEYHQTYKDLLGRITLAESDLDMWHDRAAWSSRMSRKGYVDRTEVQGDQRREDGARMAFERLAEEMRVLEGFKKRRMLAELEGRLVKAKQEVDRVRRQSRARQNQTNSVRLSRQLTYQRREQRCREIEEDIRRCAIHAPHDGLVVHDVSDQARSGSGSQQSLIAQGEPVRTGQRLLFLPDLSRLVIHTKVHEALVGRLRADEYVSTGFGDGLAVAQLVAPGGWTRLLGAVGFDFVRDDFRDQERRLVRGGQPVLVRLDAEPERLFRGHVRDVAVLSTYDWWAGGVETYETVIALDEPVEGARPDMSAEVTIQLDGGSDHTLTVPREALLGGPAGGRQKKCQVVTESGVAERDVTVGLVDEGRVEITAGLRQGEAVVLHARGTAAE
jgi:HlyD family secretion protein